MIRQLVDPQFVKARVEYLSSGELDRAPGSLPKDAEESALTVQEFQEVQALLADLAASGDYSRKEGEAVWMPRDANLGIVQSVLEEFYQTHHATRESTARGFIETPDPISDDGLKAEWIPTAEKPFMKSTEESDVFRWGLSFLIAKAIAAKRGIARFNEPTAPVEIGAKARLVLFADWATGVRRALLVRDQIKNQLAPANAGDRDRHVIHLGDVYYAGREFEYRKNVAKEWPVTKAEADKIGSWCLNGNHDMFSGGKPLFDFLSSDPRFDAQSGCNFFALENKHWLIFGLDTAYESEGLKGDAGGLAEPQAEWMMAQIRRAPNKKVILLSHHQPFSAWEGGSPLTVRKLGPVLEHGVTAWFWGHEHRCAVYEGTRAIKYPALIGHGGVPVYASKKQPHPEREKVRFWDQRFFKHYFEKYSYLGFAVLDLDGEQATVRYIDENGKPTKDETDQVL